MEKVYYVIEIRKASKNVIPGDLIAYELVSNGNMEDFFTSLDSMKVKVQEHIRKNQTPQEVQGKLIQTSIDRKFREEEKV